MNSMSELEKMKVPDLKAALKARGLNTAGNKKQLIERLMETSSKSVSTDSTLDEDDDEVNEDYVLGEGDETIEDDPKSADLFINEEVILSPVTKSKPLNLIPEKENKEIPVVTKSEEIKAAHDDMKILTEQERRELRSKRFNTISDDKQKAVRAERFGIAATTTNTNTTVGSAVSGVNNIEKLKQRADRFGVVSSTSLMKVEEKDRFLKRKARFGIGTTPGQFADEEERKKKRAERFEMK